MPNAESPGVRQLLQYWGTITSSGAAHYTTAALWAAVKSAALAAGNQLQGVTIQDMNYLRAAANSLLRAQTVLSNAEDRAIIDRDMISRAPWSSVQAGDDLLQKFSVRFETVFNDGTGPKSYWLTDYYYGQLPWTVGELRDQLSDTAVMNAENGSPPSAGGFESIGAVQIITGL